ncbi:hypothetical protein PV04_10660 [Phialophora macrospora]|uniref:FAD-binding domain-containing protein n=1 Tax=Phialophora macrospora TaxID=1851006 RepID=A0A0D2DJH8_9EURO|nr:hypothetical protein PV04_10660 [Phialophora macrospora]
MVVDHTGPVDHAMETKAKHPLKIIIVGAGISGLALASLLGRSGHTVTVLETAPVISEVGAGINCSPNLTRLLNRWGFDERIRKHSDALARIDLRRWEDGEFLGAATLMPEVERRHGAPQYVIHRADLHAALLEEAETVADIRTDSTVVAISFEQSAATLASGAKLEADVIVGADGMKSTCRKLIYEALGLSDKARPTGDAAFRACIPLGVVTDPDLRAFMTEPVATRWMGPDRHIQGYPIRHGAVYNMVMCHPDTGFSEESWTASASKQEILDHFGSWDATRLGKLLDFVPSTNVMKWRLCEHDPLPTWVMGTTVLLGDACHPMLPYVAQGAAQAVEDAGVLCLALNSVSHPEDIACALKAYELSRRARAEAVAGTAGATRNALHLHDGPEQQARDEKFRSVAAGGENPDLLGDAKAQSVLWGHDPEKQFQDEFESLMQKARDLVVQPTARIVDV